MKKVDLTVSKQNNVDVVRYELKAADVYDERVSDKVAQISGIVPFQYSDEDGKRSITSYVKAGNPLETMIKKTLDKKSVLAIVSGLAAAFEVGAQGVPVSYIVKDTNYIYVDEESLSVKCLLLPIKQDVMSMAELPKLFREILSKLRYDEKDKDNYVAKLITLVNSDDFSVSKLKDLADKELEQIGYYVSKDNGLTNMNAGNAPATNNGVKVNKLGVMNNMMGQQPMMGQPPMMGGQPPKGQPMPQGMQGGRPPMMGQPPMMGGQAPMQGQPPMGQPMPQGMQGGRPPMPGQPPMMGGQAPMQGQPPMGQPPMGQPAPQGMQGGRPPMPGTPQAMMPGAPKPPVAPATPEAPAPAPQGMPKPGQPPMGQPVPMPGAPKPAPVPNGMPGQPPMGQPVPMPGAPKPAPASVAPEAPKPAPMPAPVEEVKEEKKEEPAPEAPKPPVAPAAPEMPKPPVMPVAAPTPAPAPAAPNPAPADEPKPGEFTMGNLVGQLGVKPVPHIVRKNTGEAINITKPEFTIGKSKTKADYAIENNTAISRVHCIIVQRDGVNYIKDNNSTNHTYVNGVELEPGKEVLLKNKTVIQLGDEEFTFLLRKGE